MNDNRRPYRFPIALDLTTPRARVQIVPAGLRVASITITQMTSTAVVKLYIGANANPETIAPLMGWVFPIPVTDGIWIDNAAQPPFTAEIVIGLAGENL